MNSARIIHISREYANGFPQSADTSARNFADVARIEMSKLAPYATGALVRSLATKKAGNASYNLVAGVPYAIMRNFNNNLHPSTKHYVERGTQAVLDGNPQRWWRAEL